MAAPRVKDRKVMYFRDQYQCASCGSTVLSCQHRRAVGAGGSKTPPSLSDMLTLCPTCNAHCEGPLQARALAYGWKVRRWVTDPTRVPVFYPQLFTWFRLDDDGGREPIGSVVALDMMTEVYGDEYFQWRAAA